VRSFLDEGLALQVGLSEVSVDEIKAAQDAGLPVASVQNRYNLADRACEDVVDFCEANGIAFIPWAPIASGSLARPGGALDQVAHEHPGVTTSQLALAWLLRRSPVIVPIPGTGSVAHLEENLAAADVELTDAQFDALTAAA